MLMIDEMRHWFGADRSGPALSCEALHLRAGELVAIIGPSGSGKTTLLNLIAGLLTPDEGSIVVDDYPLSSMSERLRERWRREHCGLIFQNFHLDPDLDAARNVLLPAYFKAFSARRWRNRATALLDQFEVGNRTSPVRSCSRGEQQRIALARALLFDPPIILADEPTASLDEDNAVRAMQHLKTIAQSGRLVLVSTHDLTLLSHVDRILRISHGEVFEL